MAGSPSSQPLAIARCTSYTLPPCPFYISHATCAGSPTAYGARGWAFWTFATGWSGSGGLSLTSGLLMGHGCCTWTSSWRPPPAAAAAPCMFLRSSPALRMRAQVLSRFAAIHACEHNMTMQRCLVLHPAPHAIHTGSRTVLPFASCLLLQICLVTSHPATAAWAPPAAAAAAVPWTAAGRCTGASPAGAAPSAARR